MTFTYDPSMPIGRIRFLIGDTVEDSGILPGGSNFSDEEVEACLDSQEDVAEAAAVEMLEAARSRWTLYVDTTVGPLKESLSQVANSLASRASRMRSDYGISTVPEGSGDFATAVTLKRVDAYSEEDEEK